MVPKCPMSRTIELKQNVRMKLTSQVKLMPNGYAMGRTDGGRI
jgi:hypothetical protein